MEAFLVTHLVIAVLIGPGAYKPVHIEQRLPWTTMADCQAWLENPEPSISGISNKDDKIVGITSKCYTKEEILKGDKPAVFRGSPKEKQT